MNSLERFNLALHHQEADRIPIDLDSTATTGITAIAYNQLKQAMHLAGPPRLYDLLQQLAIVEAPVRERFGVDFLPVLRAPEGLDPAHPGWRPWNLPDGSPAEVPDGFMPEQDAQGDLVLRDADGRVTHKMPQGGYYFDAIYYPLAEATRVSEVEAYPLPPVSQAEMNWMAEQARRLSTTTDKVLVLRTRARILEVGHALRGWDRFMMDLMTEPALAQAVLEKALAHHLDNLARMLDAVGGYIHVVMIADDLGSQNGPLISPKLYQKMIKPYHRQLIEFIKARSGLPVFLHSCGSIYRFLPDLVEIGVDILNPVQFTARDMQPERLKGEFGKDLVFWGGGSDTQNVLPFGTPAQVREHVRRQIEIFAPGGGFVFNPVHNIQAAVPPENVIAMYETALEYGKY